MCQAMHNPTIEDIRHVKHLLHYLRGAIAKNLFYHRNSDSSHELFSDADCASSPNDRCSTGGYLKYLGKNLILWSTRKHQNSCKIEH